MKTSRLHRSRVLTLGSVILALLVQGAAVAAKAAETKVVLAVDGIKVVRNLPVLVAEHLGYFKDEGLAVTFMETAVTPEVDGMLADGRVAGVMAFYHHTIVAQAEGRDCISVIAMGASPGYVLLVASQLKDKVSQLSDLKGKRIITGGAHSAKSTSANMLLLHQGFSTTDFTPLPTKDKAANAETLKSGGADFIIAPEPDASFYQAQGVATPFADLYSAAGTRRALGSAFPSTVLYMSAPYARAHPELARQLVRAFSRALKFINTHSAAEITAAVPDVVGGEGKDPRVIAQGMKMFATDGLMEDAAARSEAKAISALFHEYAKVDLAKTYTNEFIAAVLKK